MIELLLASVIVGSAEIAPNVIKTEYLTPTNQIVIVVDQTNKYSQTK